MSSVCDNCGDTVSAESDWGYPCLIGDCSKEFKSRDRLDNHIRQIHPETLPWNDPEEIERLYWEEGVAAYEIADEMGCCATTILNKMEEFGIDTREAGTTPAHSTPAYYYIKDDYGVCRDVKGEEVSVHQLLACLNQDPHEVFAENTAVHHGNNNHPHLPETEHPRANWEGNLQVMAQEEHSLYHKSQKEEPTQPEVQSAMDW